jgi:hypothetical protein
MYDFSLCSCSNHLLFPVQLFLFFIKSNFSASSSRSNPIKTNFSGATLLYCAFNFDSKESNEIRKFHLQLPQLDLSGNSKQIHYYEQKSLTFFRPSKKYFDISSTQNDILSTIITAVS